ncbi:valine--tRNA ligase-like [Centruroides sculpturatus]|uniref:valine--tRNA ligase-like n=1 Tax=Centruroides sculpturatus TaxID=218467 RepID=UPI000C6D6E4F|nr:valine--tRNA ligase-like [Centruroides sculpturatus]
MLKVSKKSSCLIYFTAFRINRLCTSTIHLQNTKKLKKLSVKDVSGRLPSAYDPKLVESMWYEWWQKQKYFKPDDPLLSKNESKVFSMVIPPPNITGPLHLGHALTIAIQDTIIRWNRMLGNKVLWIPGCDHAGIATQVVVEKKLFNERKQSRHEVGKEEFLKEIHNWKDEKINKIHEQFYKLGSMLDFDRSVFTMDSNMSKAVREAFIKLFNQGLIYRKERFVHWSCILQSAIADFEVEHLTLNGRTMLSIPGMNEPVEFGIIDRFAYPIMNSNEHIIVSTTRLETMLGDTAIAVHSQDSRYHNFIGKLATHPFTGENIPIISDDSVNISFGTGALKVTPAHSEFDFEIAEKYNLPFHEIFDDSGKIKENYGQFRGLPRFVARKLIREALKEKELYHGNTDHATTIPICSRSGDIIEPRLKDQWYLNCSEMSKKASQAAENGNIKFIPERYKIIWQEWLKNIQDWCISRQIWWGHQIPAYLVQNLSEGKKVWIAAQNEEIAAMEGSKKLDTEKSNLTVKQDEDVLDTWFSSALIPLSVHGWPDKLQSDFYPLSLMETGHDIIFYWVARMVMLGEHFTGKLPFENIIFHGILCDSLGRKMSKSLGNVIDPMDIIHGATLKKLKEVVKESHRLGYLTDEELNLSLQGQEENFPNGIPECGTDGLRFALLLHNFKSERINIDIKHIRSCRNFCNKIWQGTRFFCKTLEKYNHDFLPEQLSEKHTLNDVDKWILSRLANVVEICNDCFEKYNLNHGASAIQKFWIQEFCDIYIESVKPLIYSDQQNEVSKICDIMFNCVETFIRLISPFMPFLSEELYQRLATILEWDWEESVCIAPYPNMKEWGVWRNEELDDTFKTVLELTHAIRSMKSFYGMSHNKPVIVINVKNNNLFQNLEPFKTLLSTLCALQSLNFQFGKDEDCLQMKDRNWVSRLYNNQMTILMELQSSSEEEQILSRRKKREKIQKELEKLNKVMSDTNYRRKIPRNVREAHVEKRANLEAELKRMIENEKISQF